MHIYLNRSRFDPEKKENIPLILQYAFFKAFAQFTKNKKEGIEQRFDE